MEIGGGNLHMCCERFCVTTRSAFFYDDDDEEVVDERPLNGLTHVPTGTTLFFTRITTASICITAF